ncbi:monooxygenase 2-like [Henckelia pumila]|uniref:monooxygenase 2-like n=1 Tax=Henckelia pumila TaxID=405737 RepID=UPI003C6E0FEF
MQEMDTEICEDIVVVGAGISGLATALALHRLGIRSLVLESSDKLRITGFALTLWANAWKALDALGIGDLVRETSLQMQGFLHVSSDESPFISEQSPSQPNKAEVKFNFETRCVKRKDLLETLERELPQGTIRYSSKLVSIEESGKIKLVHLADGSVVKTKVLIGCDGANSLVAKWLGLQNPVYSGRSVIRGFVNYPDGHGFQPKFHAFFGGGIRYGFIPCDEKNVYWFCTFTPSFFHYDVKEQDPLKMKQFVLANIQKAPVRVSQIVERTEPECIIYSSLKLRLPWNILTGNLGKNNVCVVGDALHPMTPDIGQGGCSALEDSIILARCIGDVLWNAKGNVDEYTEMEKGVERYVRERRWRSFGLISAAYLVGMIQESEGRVMSFLRNKFLRQYAVQLTLRIADFDCGVLLPRFSS